jgi:hypothetical protein
LAFKPGTKVELKSTGEIGVVIHSWKNKELDELDYHIAFYGDNFPTAEPTDPPYVLRYLETSLAQIDE